MSVTLRTLPESGLTLVHLQFPFSIKWNCGVDAEFKSSFLLTKNRFMNISKPIIVSSYKTD
jgi:hypothetical protein